MTRRLLASALLAGLAACSNIAGNDAENTSGAEALEAGAPQSPLATTTMASPVGPAQLAAIRRKAAASPDDTNAQSTLIGALLSNGLGDEALKRALSLQARKPNAPDIHLLVGDARGLHGDFRGAAEEYRKAATLAFNESTAMRLIEALRRSDQADAADHVLARFLQNNPRSVPAQMLAASRAMEMRRWGEAIQRYEALRADLGDDDAVLLNNLAWAYSERGNLAAALPLAEKAWQLDPDNPAMADTYGWLLFRSGRDRRKGLALLERAARAAPGNADIRRRLEKARGR